MAKSGPKSRFTRDVLTQWKKMADNGVSQTDIARTFMVSQQTVSRELGRFTAVQQHPELADASDPVTFVQGFGNGLHALCAIIPHYRATLDLEWRDAAMAAWRVKFRKQ